jgi:hypothetical protein
MPALLRSLATAANAAAVDRQTENPKTKLIVVFSIEGKSLFAVN